MVSRERLDQSLLENMPEVVGTSCVAVIDFGEEGEDGLGENLLSLFTGLQLPDEAFGQVRATMHKRQKGFIGQPSKCFLQLLFWSLFALTCIDLRASAASAFWRLCLEPAKVQAHCVFHTSERYC